MRRPSGDEAHTDDVSIDDARHTELVSGQLAFEGVSNDRQRVGSGTGACAVWNRLGIEWACVTKRVPKSSAAHSKAPGFAATARRHFQHPADSDSQLVGVDWFRQVVIRPEMVHALFGCGRLEATHEYDRNLGRGRVLLESSAHRESIGLRNHDVQQHQVRMMLHDGGERRIAGSRRQDVIPVGGQPTRHKFHIGLIIINYEDCAPRPTCSVARGASSERASPFERSQQIKECRRDVRVQMRIPPAT